MTALQYSVVLIFGMILVFAVPIRVYSVGKKKNDKGIYGPLALALWGALFFAYMILIAYFETTIFKQGTYAGVEEVLISIVGLLAIVVGLIWRIIEGFKKED
jgi:hypothetical protein